MDDWMDDSLEKLWGDLLSRDPVTIRTVFAGLDEASKKVVMHHLKRMVREPGWHPEQVTSAQAAMDTLAIQRKQKKH